jgi:hypothetical protein
VKITAEDAAAAAETIQVECLRLRMEELLAIGEELGLADGFSFGADGRLVADLTEMQQVALAAALVAARRGELAREDESFWSNEGMEAL